jgi:hypothetical protein
MVKPDVVVGRSGNELAEKLDYAEKEWSMSDK